MCGSKTWPTEPDHQGLTKNDCGRPTWNYRPSWESAIAPHPFPMRNDKIPRSWHVHPFSRLNVLNNITLSPYHCLTSVANPFCPDLVQFGLGLETLGRPAAPQRLRQHAARLLGALARGRVDARDGAATARLHQRHPKGAILGQKWIGPGWILLVVDACLLTTDLILWRLVFLEPLLWAVLAHVLWGVCSFPPSLQ